MNPNPYIDEDLQALAETARRFATERVAPGFLERDKTRDLNRELLRIDLPGEHHLLQPLPPQMTLKSRIQSTTAASQKNQAMIFLIFGDFIILLWQIHCTRRGHDAASFNCL